MQQAFVLVVKKNRNSQGPEPEDREKKARDRNPRTEQKKDRDRNPRTVFKNGKNQPGTGTRKTGKKHSSLLFEPHLRAPVSQANQPRDLSHLFCPTVQFFTVSPWAPADLNLFGSGSDGGCGGQKKRRGGGRALHVAKIGAPMSIVFI